MESDNSVSAGVEEIDEVSPIPDLINVSGSNRYGNLNEVYTSYVNDPSPVNLNAVVSNLKPSISYALTQVNAFGDPLMQTEAKLIAAEAVKNYDPSSGAGLPTWVSTQLFRLKRKKRELGQPVKVPDRAQLDAWNLEVAEREFIDENDREPDVLELADYSGIPVQRISKIRNSFRVMPSELSVEGLSTESLPDYMEEALAYVHHDADYIDRKILEHKTGYGGAAMLSNPEISKRFKLTPSQLSRRAKKISFRIQEIQDSLEEL